MNLIEINNLRKNYGVKEVLKGLDLSLKNGQVYTLLGKNGAGKTTFINILLRLIKEDSGSVVSNVSVKKEVGVVFQEDYFPKETTVSDLIKLQASFFHKKVNVDEELKKMGLEKEKFQKVGTLSGGQKRKLSFLLATLHDPKLLILDEPTAGLDPIERRNLRNLIASISSERIILLATHVISDVEFIASQIILMKQGKILACASQQSLMEHTDVYESSLDINTLLSMNPSIKIVNQTYVDHEMHTRFISDIPIGNCVSTTLDDVYLDWLG